MRCKREAHWRTCRTGLDSVRYRQDREAAIIKSREHVALTHAGKSMAEAAILIADMLWQILSVHSLHEVILAAQRSQVSPYARYPFEKWSSNRDEDIIGPKLSPAYYVEDSVPATLNLAFSISIGLVKV